jgi:hypothetical protein
LLTPGLASRARNNGEAENHTKRVGNIVNLKFSFLQLKSNIFMKKMKLIVSAFAVLAVVGSALAFKASNFNQANVFCLTTGSTPAGACPTGDLVLYIPDAVDHSGDVTNPCPTGQSPYVNSGSNCVESSSPFFMPVAE